MGALPEPTTKPLMGQAFVGPFPPPYEFGISDKDVAYAWWLLDAVPTFHPKDIPLFFSGAAPVQFRVGADRFEAIKSVLVESAFARNLVTACQSRETMLGRNEYGPALRVNTQEEAEKFTTWWLKMRSEARRKGVKVSDSLGFCCRRLVAAFPTISPDGEVEGVNPETWGKSGEHWEYLTNVPAKNHIPERYARLLERKHA